jgi:hypothetical protein
MGSLHSNSLPSHTGAILFRRRALPCSEMEWCPKRPGRLFVKFIRWIFFALLVTGVAPLRVAAQTVQPSHEQEFQDCVDEFSVCHPAALNAQERQAVQRVAQDRNLRNCMYGFADCNTKQLNAEQQKEVARANDNRNLQNCLDGIGRTTSP